jgi:hypothetical protein
MGRPNGANAEDPMSYTRKHSKEPVLPDREQQLLAPLALPADVIMPSAPRR